MILQLKKKLRGDLVPILYMYVIGRHRIKYNNTLT